MARRLTLQRVQAWVQRACEHPLVKERLQVRPGGRRVNSGDQGAGGGAPVHHWDRNGGRGAAVGAGLGVPGPPERGRLGTGLGSCLSPWPLRKLKPGGGCLRPFRAWEAAGPAASVVSRGGVPVGFVLGGRLVVRVQQQPAGWPCGAARPPQAPFSSGFAPLPPHPSWLPGAPAAGEGGPFPGPPSPISGPGFESS